MEALVPKAARGGGIRTRAEVVEHNEPALAICRVADQFDADLICMAARTRPWFHAPLFGSVAQRVMVRSGRPVLITRSPGREPDGQTLVATLTKNGG
jgi:nucleotide-binding universal stress UspA family protein